MIPEQHLSQTYGSVLRLDVVVCSMMDVLEIPEYDVKCQEKLIPRLDLRFEDQRCQFFHEQFLQLSQVLHCRNVHLVSNSARQWSVTGSSIVRFVVATT